MRKISLLLVFVIMLSIVLSSCGKKKDPEDVYELWERIDEQMSELKSYKMDMSINVNCTIDGVRIELEGTSSTEISNFNNKKLYLHEQMTINTKADEKHLSTTNRMLRFADGVMYVTNEQDGKYSYLSSELSAEEFRDYYSDTNEEYNFDPMDASTKTMEKGEDLTWKITAEKFGRERVDELWGIFGLDTLGVEVDDVSMYVLADEKFRVTEIKMDFISNSQQSSVISMLVKFSNFNSVEKTDTEYPMCKEVDDARVIKWISSGIKDLSDAENGEFNVLTCTKVYDDLGKEIEKYTKDETCNIRFENDDDGVELTADISDGENTMNIRYSKKVLKVTVDKKTETQYVNEEYGQQLLDAFIGLCVFDEYTVRDVEKTADGVYKLECVVPESEKKTFADLITSVGDIYMSHEVYYVAAFKDGKLKELEYHIIVNGTSHEYTVVKSVDFDPEE